MKREIKFRAWIYGLGKMTPVKEIDFDGYMSSVRGKNEKRKVEVL